MHCVCVCEPTACSQSLGCSPLCPLSPPRLSWTHWPCSSKDSSEVRGDLPSTPQKEGAGNGRGGGERAEETGDAVAVSETQSFALQVERAIAVINTILYWKTTSVVQEAVQFCVTVSSVWRTL